LSFFEVEQARVLGTALPRSEPWGRGRGQTLETEVRTSRQRPMPNLKRLN